MGRTDRLLPLEDGPWNGMIDSVAPTSKHPGKYYFGQNIYPLDPAIGDGVIGRPGVRVMGDVGGAIGSRRVQGIYQFTKKDGTEYTVRIVGGKFYTLDWATEIWTEVLTAANLTAAAVAIDATAMRIGFLTFTDKLYVTDGTNLPWLWDGTTGGGITKLTNSPVVYGQPTLYAGRIFAIKKTDPATFVWSEADVPNTGYEAGGFNNSWTITQTDPNRLYRLLGTNDALNVFRARSATQVTGTVTSSFVSAATKDSLSETEGTTSPWAVITQDVNVMFMDADMHPYYVRPGASGASGMWTAYRETLKKVPKTPDLASKAMTLLYSPAQLLFFALCDVGATEPNMMLVYDVKGGDPVPVGIWRGWEMTVLAMVKNAVGTPYLLHGDSSGYVYLHGNPEDSTPWNDALVTGTNPVHHILELQALGFDVRREKIFDRLDMSLRALTPMTLNISVKTPRGQSAPQQIFVPSIVPGWDTGLWDDMLWDPDAALSTIESHADVGIDEESRWVKPYIDHSTLNEQFGMVAVSLDAYLTDDDPEIP